MEGKIKSPIYFLTSSTCETLTKNAMLTFTRELEELTFNQINEIILRHKKRVIIVERIKFMALKQEQYKPILNCLHRLQDANRFCEF